MVAATGWNLWVWLQCIGVASASGCCCKEVAIYIDILTIIINFPYSTCISSFFGSSIPTSLFIFKMFFRSCKNKNKKPKWRLLTSQGAHLNCAIMAMLYTHSIGNQL